jgi:hypothetical protein
LFHQHIDMGKESASAANENSTATEEDNFAGLYDSEDEFDEGDADPRTDADQGNEDGDAGTKASVAAPTPAPTPAPAPAFAPAPAPEPEPEPEPESATSPVDYGAVSAEPSVGCRVLIKLPSGKKLNRTYGPGEPVRVLYAVALEALGGGNGESNDVDVFQAFPREDLRAKLDMTLEESGLAGSQVMVAWR